MAKADRLEQADLHRAALERDYHAALIAALETCATGRWGLFAHRNDKRVMATTSPVIDELDDLAASIARLRDQLGVAPFTLHDEFLAARGPASPSAVGEPKQAKAWLERLAQDARSVS